MVWPFQFRTILCGGTGPRPSLPLCCVFLLLCRSYTQFPVMAFASFLHGLLVYRYTDHMKLCPQCKRDRHNKLKKVDTIVLKPTHLKDAGAAQSMDVKKCNRVNAFQTSWSAPLMVLTPGPVFQVQSGKEENYIKCRKLRGLY